MHHWIAWWPTLIVLAVATVTDLRSRRIPNWLVLPFLAAGILVSPWRLDWSGIGHGHWARADWAGVRPGVWHGLGQSFAGLGVGLLIYGILYLRFGMGAGDVKLCTAIGAWVGPAQVFWALFLTALAGGVMVLCWIAYRMVVLPLVFGVRGGLLGGKKSGIEGAPETSIADLLQCKVPYAPAIAVGTFLSFFVA